jgi:alkanesulfonate monooxygenase SsuD/methylene tetrahydromethanopterin reductase-like flavin-dependent oxidoreductase (luciferase family)
MTGVIGHIANPTLDQSVALAREAETAGADWIGLADAFWWRDVWMALAQVATSTTSIEIGPAMTNAYLRHPFHTVSALATLQELAPGRTFLGVTAGGSEVTMAAGRSRADAPDRVRHLVELMRGCAAGAPLDVRSGRSLDVPLAPLPVLVAGRGGGMLRTAGAIADRVLLWAIPDSDLARTVGAVLDGARGRPSPPALVWAPLVEHAPALRASIMHVAVYASLNTRPAVRRGWGLDDELVERIRSKLVAGGTAAAVSLVPEAAVDDLLVRDRDPGAVAARARSLGIGSIAVPGYGVDSVGEHVAWAHAVEAAI